MDDLTDVGTASDVVVPETTADSTGPSEGSGFNPAWEPIKEKLGDPAFQLIQDELSKWDSGVNKRFETLNQQFSPYKELGTPEEIQVWKTVIQQLDADPVAVYEQLGKFLEENGRMPTREEVQEVQEDLEEGPRDPRVDQLMQSQQQLMQMIEDQQMAEIQAEADAGVQREVDDLVNSRGYSTEDMREIVSRAFLFSQQNPGKQITLAQAADGFDEMRNRILSTPRPSDSAPTLLPTSGGAPGNSQKRSVGELSREETQDLIASVLSQKS